MALRVTLSSLLSSTALGGSKRVTSHYLLSTIPLAGQKAVTTHLLASVAPFAGDKRVTAHYLQSVASIHQAFFPILLDDSTIFDGNRWDLQLVQYPIPEHNPYRPRIPEQLVRMGDDFYNFAEENQQILREQHNITQAGDTTFPFQLVLEAHDNKLYKLGSIGRFYHQDYGVMLARYVQFSEMKSVAIPHAPVGLFKKADTLDWIVTNNYTLSHPNLVVGLSAPAILPTEGQYGWAIIDGPNLEQIQNTSTTAAIGESLVWADSGIVSNSAPGKILGRRVNKVATGVKTITPGQMWVRIESFSEASLNTIISAATAALQATIAQIQAEIGALPTTANLATLQASLSALNTKLSLEITNRQQVDAAIEAQLAALNAVTETQLNNAISIAITNIETQITNLTSALAATTELAQQAWEAATTLNLGTLQSQIDAILATLATEINHPKGRFPVVDGHIPPNLAYTADGSLVYVETF